ncbi:transcription factor PIF6 isoform X2 [Brassica rapa]|uniref:transcription factor PIF6 isoform X2 n=1 Tax=Brassica campestris TaxID=3711 RepID=UPI0004F17C42|nr:transcription factor PIF6 isoform X2 [Brassica rapa]
MTSPSPSTFRPKLKDQEYMELVFENGQFLAKSQRSKAFSLENQRTKSIVDLYEDEYNEDFMKSIIHGADKKLQVCSRNIMFFIVAAYETKMLMNHHLNLVQSLKASSSKKMVVDYENRKDNEFIPPDEQSVVAERSVELGFDSTEFTEDSEGSTYLSSSLDDESDDPRPRVPARTRKSLVKRRRSNSNELYNSSEKNQRSDINKKMRKLQNLLPNSGKDDNESTLDEAINYMTTLQLQVQMMTMSNRFAAPAMMLPLGPHYSQMGLPTCMQMGLPQFLPPPVLGSGGNSADMLRFLNHPTGLITPMQNSALFTPMGNYFPPSCAAFPNQIQNSTSLSNLDDATTDGGSLSGKK